MKTNHYFAGGNTAQGFFSCFDSIMPVNERRRMFYLKGGPGVGKSTFMRRIGQAAEAAGHRTEYFHCSSDPDSLDGVALPELGAALMDGTAPHVYDPVIPGARDTLISLGDFLDEDGLRPALQTLRELQTDISGRFGRCYHYLTAAAAVRSASAQGEENPAKAKALADEWTALMPLRGGMGGCRQLFGSAYTPKGQVSLWEQMAVEKRLVVECPPGCDATGLMTRLAQAAAFRGLDSVALLHPLEPAKLEAVLIPEHGLLYMAAPQGREPDALPADRLFDLKPGKEHEQGFDRNAQELLIQRALEQLAIAKGLHDELEKPYVKHMDFERWNEKLSDVMKALELA